MQTIGSTSVGEPIVVMSRQEHEIFMRLAAALNGNTKFWLDMGERKNIDQDLAGAFDAIARWSELKMGINLFKAVIVEFEEALQIQKKE